MPPKFSIIPVRAYQDPSLHPAAFKVLASLGSYADKRGYCFPSQATLAKNLHVSRQAVNRQIRILIEHGYLIIARRVHPSGAELSCFYQILFEDQDVKDKGMHVRDIEEIDLERRNNIESPGDEKTLVISKSASPKKYAQFGTEKTQPGFLQNFVLQDKSPTIADVSVPVTNNIADSATPDVTVPEASEVAQTTHLTPSLTTVVDGEEMGLAGFKTNLPPLPPGQGSRNSNHRRSSSPSTVKSDPGSPFHGEFDPKITSTRDTRDFRDSHPDLQIYLSITHHPPRSWELGSVLLAMRTLRMKYPQDSDLLSFLKPFWERWCTSRRPNGTRYNPVNSAWLTDWALSAAMCVPTEVHIDSSVSRNPGSFKKAMDPTPERHR